MLRVIVDSLNEEQARKANELGFRENLTGKVRTRSS